jgi:hypothetical protein
MPDVMLRHVDGATIERIRLLARERGLSINEIMVCALRHGLEMSSAVDLSESEHDAKTLAALPGHWDEGERVVFEEALRALARTRPTQLAPERTRLGQSVFGAE